MSTKKVILIAFLVYMVMNLIGVVLAVLVVMLQAFIAGGG